jgi:hypothetical protein
MGMLDKKKDQGLKKKKLRRKNQSSFFSKTKTTAYDY